MIMNKRTKKCYSGEAKNLAVRLGNHYSNLCNKSHDCEDLQRDWNRLGAHNFVFKILKMN